jgi:hypothetical protein
VIHIALGQMHPLDPADDPLGRSYAGWYPGMTDSQLYQANRGCYRFEPRAHAERHVLLSAEGVIRQAIRVDAIVPAGPCEAIEGEVLTAGDPVHDTYVNRPSPMKGVREIVTYLDGPSTAPLPRCACGCGEPVGYGHFRPGHDTDALYERVARIGTLPDFLRWFDRVHPATTVDSPTS